MAGGSLRKKPIKRSSPKLGARMASASASQSPSPSSYRRISVFVIVFLLVSVVGVMSVSSSVRATFGLFVHRDQIYSVQVVREFPHDPRAFTQGLLYAGNDTLFESTGLYGHSSVRKVALRTGKVMALHQMGSSYFGEGLTLIGDRLFQVTWLDNNGFIYDQNNLSRFKRFTNHMHDGWGLATDGKVIFGSDGTSTMYQIDPETLQVIQKHTVKYKNRELYNINEIEYINGEIWANVYQTDCIARISPQDGIVIGWVLLPNLREGLVAAGYGNVDVLNGIAWDRGGDRIFVTGKLWPTLYEIKLQAARKPSPGYIEQMCMPMPFEFGKP